MNNLEEMQRIIYEHYTDDELLEYHKRKILQLKQNEQSKEQLIYYLIKLQEVEQKIEKKGRTK